MARGDIEMLLVAIMSVNNAAMILFYGRNRNSNSISSKSKSKSMMMDGWMETVEQNNNVSGQEDAGREQMWRSLQWNEYDGFVTKEEEEKYEKIWWSLCIVTLLVLGCLCEWKLRAPGLD